MQRYSATVGNTPQSGVSDQKARKSSDDFTFGTLLQEMGSLRSKYTNKQNPSLDFTTLQFADCKTIPNDTQFIIEDSQFDISLESANQIISSSTLHANNLSDIDEQNSPEKQKKPIKVYETKKAQSKPTYTVQKKSQFANTKENNLQSQQQQQQKINPKPSISKLKLCQVQLEYYQKPKQQQNVNNFEQYQENKVQENQIVKLEKGQSDLLKEIRLQKSKLEKLNKEYTMGESLLTKFKDQQDLRKSQQSNDLTSRSDCSTGANQQMPNRRSSAFVKGTIGKNVLTDSDTSTQDDDSNKNPTESMPKQRIERKGKSSTMIINGGGVSTRYQRRQSHNFSLKLGHSKMSTYFDNKNGVKFEK